MCVVRFPAKSKPRSAAARPSRRAEPKPPPRRSRVWLRQLSVESSREASPGPAAAAASQVCLTHSSAGEGAGCRDLFPASLLRLLSCKCHPWMWEGPRKCGKCEQVISTHGAGVSHRGKVGSYFIKTSRGPAEAKDLATPNLQSPELRLPSGGVPASVGVLLE